MLLHVKTPLTELLDEMVAKHFTPPRPLPAGVERPASAELLAPPRFAPTMSEELEQMVERIVSAPLRSRDAAAQLDPTANEGGS